MPGLRFCISYRPLSIVAVLLYVILQAPYVAVGQLQYFTDRTSWEQALGGPATVENFNDIPMRLQLQLGINHIGLLDIEVERASGNLIVEGRFYNTVNGTNFWRIEAATQNGPTPPVTPAVLFDQPITGFGADWNFFLPRNATMTIGSETIFFSDHVAGLTFFGVIDPDGFDRVEFDVVNPFNTLFHADDVSFCVVPEPATLLLLGLGEVMLSRKRNLAT